MVVVLKLRIVLEITILAATASPSVEVLFVVHSIIDAVEYVVYHIEELLRRAQKDGGLNVITLQNFIDVQVVNPNILICVVLSA